MTRNLDPKEMTEEGHPLFLTDDEDEHPVVSQIQVTRMENGQQVYAPRMRQAAELQSLDQISGEFGGGIYVLVARHNGRIVTSRKYVIPGKPKPMYDEAEAPGPQTPVAATTIAPNPMTEGGGIMGMLVTMMQMLMQSQAQASQQNTQLMIAMMSSGRESNAEDRAAARAEMQANIERERIASANNLAMMREMMTLQSKPSGGAGEDFTRGVEFMRSFATQQIEALRATTKGEDTDWGSILETLGQVMQGAGALKGIMGGGVPAEVVAQAAEVVQ